MMMQPLRHNFHPASFMTIYKTKYMSDNKWQLMEIQKPVVEFL